MERKLIENSILFDSFDRVIICLIYDQHEYILIGTLEQLCKAYSFIYSQWFHTMYDNTYYYD